jgi:CpeT protein
LLRITPDPLMLKDGCEVVLYMTDNGYFAGGTVDKNCQSDLRGASYATSTVLIYKDKLISRDRGLMKTAIRLGFDKGKLHFFEKG